MLDIKFIREHADLVKDAVRKKQMDLDVQRLLDVDQKRLDTLKEVEEMRAKQNAESNKIAQIQDGEERQAVIGEMKKLKEELVVKEKELKELEEEWGPLMLRVPNIPDPSVPEGKSDEENKEIKKWGKIPEFGVAPRDFEPKSHIELMEKLEMVDFERGAKVSGFRGYFLKGDGALLTFAIWQYALEFFSKKDFNPFIPPVLVRSRNLFGTGHFPADADDVYKTQDDDIYLAGTAEVPMMGLHADEVLNAEDFPRKYIAFSPCYRREAGSYSRDVKGLIRVHEFFKFEQIVLCKADHEESVKYHEEINRNTEEFIESLNIPYRTVVNCGGDLGIGQVKKYDVELWVPGENKYREISSASYFHDFQTRRLNIRYKDGEGKMKFAHSLNSTAIPTPRIIVSLVENYQQKDGTIIVPDALRKYMGKDIIY